MKFQCEIELEENTVERDTEGRIIYHPLYGPYGHFGNFQTYGYLTFAGHDLDKSPVLDDVKVFYLKFFGEPESVGNREAWADPLRATILQRLSGEKKTWYLGVIPRLLEGKNPTDPAPFGKELESWQGFSDTKSLESAIVQSEIDLGFGRFLPRIFFQIPNQSLANAVLHCWQQTNPGHPIEGYCMMSGQIEWLRQWDKRPRDDHLFREVIDRVFIAFYTYPSEHCHFAFVTNKLTLEELKKRLDLGDLERQVAELGLHAGENIANSPNT